MVFANPVRRRAFGTRRSPIQHNGPIVEAVEPRLLLTTTTLSAVDDAYVRDGTYASTNFGTATELQMKDDAATSYERDSYLKFDTSTAVGTVSSATLRLNGSYSVSGTVTIAAKGVSDTTWSETTINWSNRPTPGSTVDTTNVTNTTQWYDWDLTSYLQAERALGHNTITVMLEPTATTSSHLVFKSDEAASNKPQLVVVTTPPLPTAPSNPAIVDIGTVLADLTWTDNSSDETAFKIERKTGTWGAWELVQTTAANAVSWQDEGVVAGTAYQYRVSAANANGTSATTSAVSTTTLGVAPLRVNFQLSNSTPVTGYAVDSGDLYGARGGGLTYGWNVDHTFQERERNVNPDQRLDTLIMMLEGGVWEAAIPNGKYDVTVSIGDPTTASTHRLNVEGTSYWTTESLAANVFRTATHTVTVTDGKITIDEGSTVDATRTRINYVEIAPTTVRANGSGPNGYGAAGDGVSDDQPELQAAIDAAAPNATLLLNAGSEYLIGTELKINKSVNIEGRDATVTLQHNPTYNKPIHYQSLVSSDDFTWTEPVTQGQTTFAVSIPTNKIAVGDTIFIELGQDPNDPNEENYAAICKVTANTGSSITVDRPVPFNIVQGAFNHHILKVTSLVENVSIRHIDFDFQQFSVPDAMLWLDQVVGVDVEDISGRLTIAVQVTDSRDVAINNINGQLIKEHGAAGRAFSVWQSENVSLTNSSVVTDSDASVVMLESWARDITISGLSVEWNLQTAPNNSVIFAAGDSYDVVVDDLLVDNSAGGAILLFGSGTQHAEVEFGDVEITGAVVDATYGGSLTVGGETYDSADLETDSFSFPLTPNLTGYSFPAVNGQVKSFTITPSTLQGVYGLYVLNSAFGGMNLFAYPNTVNAGQPNTFNQSFGYNSPLSAQAYPQKYVAVYTDSTLPAGAKIDITFDYFPA